MVAFGILLAFLGSGFCGCSNIYNKRNFLRHIFCTSQNFLGKKIKFAYNFSVIIVFILVICEKVEHYNFPKGVFPWSDYRNGNVLLSDLGIPQENYEIFKPPVEIKVKAIGDESGKSGVFMRQELPNHFDELIASIDDDDEDELTIIQFDEEVEEGTKVVVTLNFIDGKEDDEKVQK